MATVTQFGIPGVGNGVLQPKLKNRWRVLFIGIGAEGGSSQPLSMQAVTLTRPSIEFEQTTIHRYTHQAYVAGKYSWSPLELTIEDDVTGTASRVIQDQLQKQQFIIGAEGPFLGASPEGSLYKFAMKLEMLDGQEQVIERWTVQGAFIASSNWGNMDYSSSEAMTMELSIRFDHAFQELSGYAAGQGVATGGTGA